MGFGSMAIDDEIRRKAEQSAIRKVFRLLKEKTLEELLTSNTVLERSLGTLIEKKFIESVSEEIDLEIDKAFREEDRQQAESIKRLRSTFRRIASKET